MSLKVVFDAAVTHRVQRKTKNDKPIYIFKVATVGQYPDVFELWTMDQSVFADVDCPVGKNVTVSCYLQGRDTEYKTPQGTFTRNRISLKLMQIAPQDAEGKPPVLITESGAAAQEDDMSDIPF